MTPLTDEFFRALEDVDLYRATACVLDLLDDGTPVQRIADEVLVPAQRRVGEMWERGVWSVADEHAATAVTEAAVTALITELGTRPGDGPHVVVACAEGEWHTLPARLAAAVAMAGGARVTLLGPSLPAEHLQRRLAVGDVDVLALSCTLPPNLLGAARCVAAAHAVGVPVVTGGRAFGTGDARSRALGADAHGGTATALLDAPPPLRGRPTPVPAEVLRLDAVEPGTVALAFERLVAAYPRLGSLSPWQAARTREDLQWMARFAGAAVLTGDRTLLDDLLAWLVRLLAGKVHADVVATGAALVADAVEAEAPQGAALLRAAALDSVA